MDKSDRLVSDGLRVRIPPPAPTSRTTYADVVLWRDKSCPYHCDICIDTGHAPFYIPENPSDLWHVILGERGLRACSMICIVRAIARLRREPAEESD